MKMLRRAAWAKQGPDALLRWREADDILAELARLRRIKRAAKALVSAAKWYQSTNGFLFGAELQDAEDALKKGGRK